jgi:CBS-domain-containing membrane protein
VTSVRLKTVAPETELSAAIALIAESGLHQLAVVHDGRPVGLLSRADIVSFLQLRRGAAPHRRPALAATRNSGRGESLI